MNVYAMVGNSPTLLVDPFGMEAFLATIPTHISKVNSEKLPQAYYFKVNSVKFKKVEIRKVLDFIKMAQKRGDDWRKVANSYLERHGIRGYMGPTGGKNHQACASGAQCLAGTIINGKYYDAPNTEDWFAGEGVKGNKKLEAGTMIATFDKNGKYKPSTHQHTLIYVGQDANGVYVLDQFSGKTMAVSYYGFGGTPPNIPANSSQDANLFKVVLSCKSVGGKNAHKFEIP